MTAAPASDECDVAGDAADEHVDDDQRHGDQVAADDHRLSPEAVGQRSADQGADGPGEEEQRQEPRAPLLARALRHLPERHEREEPVVRDASQRDNREKQNERAGAVPAGVRARPAIRRPAARTRRCSRAREEEQTATTIPGIAISRPPSSPRARMSVEATTGPSAKPRLPPTEKTAMPLARRVPLT